MADPFTSLPSAQRMSATAPSFQPSGYFNYRSLPGTTQYLSEIIANEESSADFGTLTTNTATTRCIKIYGSQELNAGNMIHNCFAKLRATFTGTHRLTCLGNDAYLRCSSITDALNAHRTISQDFPRLALRYISLGDWTLAMGMSRDIRPSEHEGQVVVCFQYPFSDDRKLAASNVRRVLEQDGELCAWQKVHTNSPGACQLIAEYTDGSNAPRALARHRASVAQGTATFEMTLHEPDLVELTNPPKMYSTPTRQTGSIGSFANYPQHNFQTPIATPMAWPAYMQVATPPSQNYYQSPPNVTRQLNRYEQNFTPSRQMSSSHARSYQSPASWNGNFTPQSRDTGFRQETYQNSARRRYAEQVQRTNFNQKKNQNGTHNVVDVDRIRAGSDVRTTIMLRNIPNKIDQATLKAILDETSYGKYDFAYLRIDFSNDCNVGYAFVNFLDPLHIIEFMEAKANQKWYRFRSQKIAEVSYATIQGRDCLIQKFRNSCVMLELPIFRPKLFYTYQDIYGRVGQEEEFPPSDNPSKLRRSCENAEHVGLFAPNAGAQMRDEQRRRRSNYDRGTSLAEKDAFEAYLMECDEGRGAEYASPYHN